MQLDLFHTHEDIQRMRNIRLQLNNKGYIPDKRLNTEKLKKELKQIRGKIK